MGKFTYEKNKFIFSASSPKEDLEAQKLKLKSCDAKSLRWETRSAVKARMLGRFADDSAKLKLKNTFFTDYTPPECILYPDNLEPKLYQIENARAICSRSPIYLADEAGLGKTISVILAYNSSPGMMLIICPPFLKYNWADELRKWLVDKTTHIEVLGEDDGKSSIHKHTDILICPDSLLVQPHTIAYLKYQKIKWLIVDEAHRFKTSTAKRTEVLLGDERERREEYGIKDIAERIVFLSGTPMPNGKPIELYPILSQAAPEAISHRSYEEYGRTFCGGKRISFRSGRSSLDAWDFSGASNLKQFRKELRKKFMIRHLKKDVLPELGPKTRNLIFLDAPSEIESYEKTHLSQYSIEELIGEDYKLGDIATYRRLVGESKVVQAFSYIHYLLEHSKDKLLVGAYHIDVVESLTRMLDGFYPVMIKGGMSVKAKDEARRKFQTDPKCRVAVGNVDAMGVGVTLTAAPGLVVVEPSWVPGINEQLEDRVHRMTQKENVYIRYLVQRGTLDERVLRRVLEKQEAINQVMG